MNHFFFHNIVYIICICIFPFVLCNMLLSHFFHCLKFLNCSMFNLEFCSYVIEHGGFHSDSPGSWCTRNQQSAQPSVRWAQTVSELYRTILRYESDICDAPVIAFEEGADVMRTANASNCIITQFIMFNVCDVISQASGIATLAILMSGAKYKI